MKQSLQKCFKAVNFFLAFLVVSLLAINANAQWSCSSSINSYIVSGSTNFQNEQQQMADGSGGYFIVWSDYRSNSYYQIYAQHYNSTGVAQWTSTGVRLATSTTNQHYAQLVLDGSGGIIVAWQDSRTYASGSVFTQRVDASGSLLWGTTGQLIYQGSNADYEAGISLVGDGAGGTILAWTGGQTNNGNNGYVYYYAQYINSSQSFPWGSTPIQVFKSTGVGYPQNGRVISTLTDGSSGAFLYYAQNDTKYVLTHINSSGTLWGTPTTVITSGTGTFSLCTDGSNGVTTLFRSADSKTLYAQHFNATGVKQWGTDITVRASTVTQSTTLETISYDGSSGYFLAWEDYRSASKWQVYIQHLTAAGGIDMTANGKLISANTSANYEFPQFIKDGSGGGILTWNDNGNQIYTQDYTTTGGTNWTTTGNGRGVAVGNLIVPAGTTQINPTVVSNGSGGAIFAFQDSRASIYYRILMYQNINSNGTLGKLSYTPATTPTVSASSTANCGTHSTTLSIATGTLNDASTWSWYSGSCGGTTVGTGTSLSVSPASTTTYYARGTGACVTSSACANVTITVSSATPATPGTISASGSLSAPNYSISSVTNATSYTWALPTGWSINSGQSTTSISGTPGSNNGNVSVTASNACGTSATKTLAVTGNYTWTGATNTNWSLTSNWNSGVVPISSTNVVIPIAASNQPTLTADVSVSTIEISGSLTINAHILTLTGAVTGAGSLKGSTTSSLVIAGTVGTINFNPSNNSLQNLTITSGSATLGNALNVYGIFTPTAGTFTTGGYLTLKSTSISNTAIVGVVGGTVSGTVTVERFIPKGFRAYRDLSAGGVYSATNYLFNTWQASGTNTPGYGIFITGKLDTIIKHNVVDGITGVDHSLTGNPSAFYYRAGWDTIKNTKTELLNPYQSYRILVRGDRNFDLDTSGVLMITGPTQLAMNASTTIKATGNLITGNVTFTTSGVTNGVYTNNIGLNNASNGFSYVANPYACPIDFHNIYTSNHLTNIDPRYYYLDPTIGSTGAYVSYNAASGASSNNAPYGKFIQAGQGFLIKNTSSSPQLLITEADKSILSTSKTAVFGETTTNSKIAFSLLKQGEGVTSKMDGAVAVFGAQFSNALGIEDNTKMNNESDNFSLTEGSLNLSIDGRLPATTDDVIQLGLGQLSGIKYQLVIDASAYSGLNPFLQDAYTNTTIAIGTQVDTIAFTAYASIAASYQNRFSIIFKPTTLAVNSIVANATAKGNIATIIWNTIGESGVDKFEVEKSTDGLNFTSIAQQPAKNTTTANYTVTDNNAVSTTYYRIKSISINGSIAYSNVVILTTQNLPITTIYPNPLTGKTLNVQLGNAVAGKYVAKITNSLGQKVAEETISHTGLVVTHAIIIKQAIAVGVYTVTIHSVDNQQLIHSSTLTVN